MSMPPTLASAPASSGAVEGPVQTPMRNALPASWCAWMCRASASGVAGAGEPADADVVAVLEAGGGRLGRHDLLAQAGVGDAGRADGGRVLGHGVVLGLTLGFRYRNGCPCRQSAKKHRF